MDLLSIIGLLIGLSIFGIIIDISYAYLKNKTPYIKRFYSWVINKKYKIQLMGIKRYNFNYINMKDLKKSLYNQYSHIKIISEKENNLIVLIDNMQAPYEITITTNEGEDNPDKIEVIVKIILIGSVEFRYRESDENDKFFNELNNLFNVIEDIFNEKPIYSFFALQADIKNNLEKQPFISNYAKENCKDTIVDFDKSTGYIKVNSISKDTLCKCLKKNIHKVL